MTETSVYGRRDLVEAYLSAQRQEHDPALLAYHRSMLDGLSRLFELPLPPGPTADLTARVLFLGFASTAGSLLSLRTPWSGFLDATLLLKKIEEAGEPGARFMALTDRIGVLTAESRERHLEALDAIAAAMLGDRAGLTFTGADLRALGVDDTWPESVDYDF